MHTVIILSRHASELIKDYRFLFKPFIDDGMISFCDWNEAGTEIKEAVPDLYGLIKGRTKWRAVIVDTEPAFGRKTGPVPDKKNPFDYPEIQENIGVPRESQVPVIRLTHMLCGYPSLPVADFEDGYEYTDRVTGEVHTVRASELSEAELDTLSAEYGNALIRIYLPAGVPEENVRAEKELADRYSFADERPKEVYLIASREHPEEEDHIYDSWNSPFETESSEFCRRNRYPSICRFLCFCIINPENSRYIRELTEFWLSVLTLAINHIPASSLQAYKLYRLGVTVSRDKLEAALDSHLDKLEAAYNFVRERLTRKPKYSFEKDEHIVERQKIPVIFESVSSSDLYIDTKHIGLCRDCPGDEMDFWVHEVKEKEANAGRFLKAPRRAIDRASRHLKRKAESFGKDEYELDRFQIADLEEQINSLELEILTCDTRSMIDEHRIREELARTDRQVRKDIAARMRRNIAIGTGAALLLIYMIGYFPYIFNSLRLGSSQFLASLVLTAAAVLLASAGGIIALFLLRRKMRKSMERFNTLMRELAANVKQAAKKYEEYFSVLCTFMKAQSIYSGISRKDDTESSRLNRLKAHRQALQMSINRDRQFEAAFGIKRSSDFVKNVTSFFDEDRKPAENALYYYETDRNNTEIPLNKTGEMIRTPYRFIGGLTIEREEIYEGGKGED